LPLGQVDLLLLVGIERLDAGEVGPVDLRQAFPNDVVGDHGLVIVQRLVDRIEGVQVAGALLHDVLEEAAGLGHGEQDVRLPGVVADFVRRVADSFLEILDHFRIGDQGVGHDLVGADVNGPGPPVHQLAGLAALADFFGDRLGVVGVSDADQRQGQRQEQDEAESRGQPRTDLDVFHGGAATCAFHRKNALYIRETPGILIDPAAGNKAPSIPFIDV
jgi:hypothetical protein